MRYNALAKWLTRAMSLAHRYEKAATGLSGGETWGVDTREDGRRPVVAAM